MTVYAYLFECRSIQPFLFESGRLADMVAGSDMIDYLCGEPLDATLRACGMDADAVRAPRRNGGALHLLFDDPASVQRVQALWRVLVHQFLPGIEQVDCIASGATDHDAIREGLGRLRDRRNLHAAALPNPAPVAERSAKTGRVTVARSRHRGGEPLDAAGRVKQQFRRTDGGLVAKFAPTDAGTWPDNFEADAPDHKRFPLRAEGMVAIVHADGNGLGEVLRVLSRATEAVPREHARLYRTFSDGLDAATGEAARRATDAVLLPSRGGNTGEVFPARPLVLGGDDLTLIVRADLALDFSEAFITAFEVSSGNMLTDLRQHMEEAGASAEVVSQLPDYLTACAGVAYLKANQPFAQGHELAESLCKRAKRESRNNAEGQSAPPSSVALHRVEGSLFADARELFRRELLVERGSDQPSSEATCHALGLPAYRVGCQEAARMPSLQRLRAMVSDLALGAINEKRLRSLATALHTDLDLARQNYDRWRSLNEKQSRASQRALSRFDEHLEALVGKADTGDLPFGPPRTPNAGDCDDHCRATRHSPLADVLVLLTLDSTPAKEPSADAAAHA